MQNSAPRTLPENGKVTIAMLSAALLVFALTVIFDVQNVSRVASVQATSTATTTVTVLNTAPSWTVTARELFASATSTPTNSGSSTVWTALATDSNAEDYYLLICKSSSTPVILVDGDPPECGGGPTDQWAVSTSTISGTPAQVSTTTAEAWAESNDWYAYVCDSNPGSAQCTTQMYNGLHEGGASATSSPFVVNHRPTITLAADDSPTLPGVQVDWTTTADDPDTLGGDDTIQLHVCLTAGFDATVPGCTGVQWATSTFSITNPTATTSIPIPYQDGDVGAYVYIVDDYGHPAIAAASPWHGSSTVLTVSNAAPYIASTTIDLLDVGGVDNILNLTVPEGETTGFVLEFPVTDENGCQNTALGNEITDVDINVFRSDIGGTNGLGCDTIDEYDPNNCYTHTATSTWWAPVCVQTAASCTPTDWNNITWECTFPLWYIADATDVGSVHAAVDWRGSARATDDGTLGSSPLTGNYSTSDQGVGTTEMAQFLSFTATGSPIAYGSWQPGEDTGTHIATTTVFATGNTGLDHYLSGDAMCVTYPTCTGNATSTIYVPYQHYATTSSSIVYTPGGGVDNFELSTSTAPVLVGVDIVKTTATSSPAEDDTYWGIEVPGSVTLAGNYIGRNYIDAAVAPSSEW